MTPKVKRAILVDLFFRSNILCWCRAPLRDMVRGYRADGMSWIWAWLHALQGWGP